MANERQTEFFGPDLGRGPFSSQRIETSALQIATALAQLRAPLTRGDDELRAHADFIRELSDRLCPDWAAALTFSVAAVTDYRVRTQITVPTGTYNLLEIWLADSAGGALTSVEPYMVDVTGGTILETRVNKKHWLVLTSTTGFVELTIEHYTQQNWYWAATRLGRVYYSSRVYFP
jgi:hypothetical protein